MSLNYYAHEGMMRFNAQSKSSLSDTTVNSNGSGTNIFYNNFTLGLNYGLVPRLRVSVSEGLLWDQSNEGAANSSLSNGPSDPTFTLAWRYLEAGETGLSGDISAQLVPSIGASIPANPTANVTGNNLNGYSTATAQSVLFWRYAENEFSFTGTASRRFQGQVNGTDASTTLSISPLWQYSYGVADRLHLGNRFYIGISVLGNQVGNTIKNGADGIQKVVTHDGYWTYTGDLGYRPEPYYCFVFSVSKETNSYTSSQTNTANVLSTNKNTFAQLFFQHQFRL